MLNYKKSAFWIIVVAVVACIVVAVCFLTNPKDNLSIDDQVQVVFDGEHILDSGNPISLEKVYAISLLLGN